jgi:hypothetical protein
MRCIERKLREPHLPDSRLAKIEMTFAKFKKQVADRTARWYFSRLDFDEMAQGHCAKGRQTSVDQRSYERATSVTQSRADILLCMVDALHIMAACPTELARCGDE